MRRLFVFHIMLIPLGKVWIQFFPLQLAVNWRGVLPLQPWYDYRWKKETCDLKPVKLRLKLTSCQSLFVRRDIYLFMYIFIYFFILNGYDYCSLAGMVIFGVILSWNTIKWFQILLFNIRNCIYQAFLSFFYQFSHRCISLIYWLL